MKRVTSKIKPVNGFSQVFHLLLTVVLPISIYVLVRLSLVQLAIAMILLSKWRIFSVKPRYWSPLIKTNAVDLIVGFSTIILMINTTSALMQLIWAVAYAMWLILIKPSASIFGISTQAFVAFVYGLVAIYMEWGASSSTALMVMTWLVCYSVARHYFSGFDEPQISFLSNAWGLFGAALSWILSFWLIYHQAFSQVILLLIVIGFGLATLYYLKQTDHLTVVRRRQIVTVMILAVFVITFVFTDWSSKIV